MKIKIFKKLGTGLLAFMMMLSVMPITNVHATESKTESQNAPLADSYEILVFTLTPYETLIYEIPNFDTNTMEIVEGSGYIDPSLDGNGIEYEINSTFGLNDLGKTESIGTISYTYAENQYSCAFSYRVVNSITFNAGTGTFSDGSSQVQIGIDNGTVLTMPEEPTIANGLYFDGWYYKDNNGDFTTEFENNSLSDNETLYAKYTSDEEKLLKAKPLAEAAIEDMTTTNDTTGANILDAVNAGIASVEGVTATWKTGSPTITPATKDNAGSITGTIILTCGSETVEVTVNKSINKLPAPATEKPSSPQTGDTSNAMLYFGLIALSGCAIIFSLKNKKSINQ